MSVSDDARQKVSQPSSSGNIDTPHALPGFVRSICAMRPSIEARRADTSWLNRRRISAIPFAAIAAPGHKADEIRQRSSEPLTDKPELF